MRNNSGAIKNVTFDSDNHTNLTVESLTNLQGEISNKMAAYINREFANKKNDLGLCLSGEKSYQRLAEYIKILEELKYCNSCFSEVHPSEIISAVYQNINSL